MSPRVPVPILWRDDHLVVVSKPPGVPVHRSAEHRDAGRPLLQRVRDAIATRVYPVHRLDRAVSGALVMALDSATAAGLQRALADPTAVKRYLALVRGTAPESATIERPLTNKRTRVVQDARSHMERVAVYDTGPPFGPFSLVRVRIFTGRRHQIRRHLSHLRHQILLDTTYGKGAINRHFRAEGLARMFLHAEHLAFAHPVTGEPLALDAPLWPDLAAWLERLGPRVDVTGGSVG